MLAVAIERHQAVVAPLDGRPEGRAQAGSIAQVAGMADRPDRGEGPEQLGRPVGRAVVDDQHVTGVLEHLGEDGLEVGFLVVDRDGGEEVHWRMGW